MNPTLDYSALPFDQPSPWGRTRRVFAHYFLTFPLSIDNKPPASDYYNTQLLNPHGEKDKWLSVGGFLRQRTLPVPLTVIDPAVQPPVNWKLHNMQLEVQMAVARGITGFCFDVLSLADGTTTTMPAMMTAAAAVDKRFSVMPMLDMNALGATLMPEQAASVLVAANRSPAAMRLDDGRLVFSAYNAPKQALTWWQTMIGLLNAQNINVAFVPLLPGGARTPGDLGPISYGVGCWGTASPGPSSVLTATPAQAGGFKYLMPVCPQQFRPKDSAKGPCFWEASNSLTFRNAWLSAINTNTDWVQLVTWSDYSETSQVCPYTDASLDPRIGNGFYDLNAYFATWFATGVQPPITQDVLYWFHRKQALLGAAHLQQASTFTPVLTGGGPEEDNIEVVAFLTAPGTLVITIGGVAHAQPAPAGIMSFKVPLIPGVPRYALQRNGSNVFSFDGPLQVYGPEGLPSGLLDATYWSGSITRAGLTSYSLTTP